MTGTAVRPSQLPIAAKRRIAYAFFVAIGLEGVIIASIGPTLDALELQSRSTTEQISILFTANALGYLLGSLLGGRVFGRRSGSRAIAWSLLVGAGFTALVPVLGSLWLLVVVFAAVGIPLGMIDVGSNTLLVWLFRDRVAPYMNALHLSFGIGAFLAPLLIDRFAAITGDAADSYWLFAALMLPAALWMIAVPDPDRPEAVTGEGGTGIIRRYGVFLALMALLFFTHVGAELGFGGWIYNYAEELGVGGETTSRILNSVFWGGLVLGRLIAVPLSMRWSPRAMVTTDLVLAGIAVGFIGLLPDWQPSIWIGTAAFGIAVASVFASCINYAGERVPITGGVMSLFIVGAGIGSMTLPWVVGQLFDSRGPEWMLWIVGGAIATGLILFGWIQTYGARMGRLDT